MKLNKNSFINYINKHNTLFRISEIRNYRVRCKIINFQSNLSSLDFGHFTEFKITLKELQKYFKHNRLLPILKDKNDFLNNKLDCTLREISPQGNPIFKNFISKIKLKKFESKIKSLLILKKVFANKKIVNGRIIKRIKGGFIVAILGFFAFLPNPQYFLRSRKKKVKKKLKKIIFSQIPVKILEIKGLQFKSKGIPKTLINYELNIVISFRRGINHFKRVNRNFMIKNLICVKKLNRVKTLLISGILPLKKYVNNKCAI